MHAGSNSPAVVGEKNLSKKSGNSLNASGNRSRFATAIVFSMMLLSGTAVGVIGFNMPQNAFGAVTITTSTDTHSNRFYGSSFAQVLITDTSMVGAPSNITVMIGVIPALGGAFAETATVGSIGTSGNFEFFITTSNSPAVPLNPMYTDTSECGTSTTASFIVRINSAPAGDGCHDKLITASPLADNDQISISYGGNSKTLTFAPSTASITLDRSTAGNGNIIIVKMKDQDANIDPTSPEAFLIDGIVPVLDATGAMLSIVAPSAFLETGANSAQFEFPVQVGGTAMPGLGSLTGFTFPAAITIDIHDMNVYSPPSGSVATVSAPITLQNFDGIISLTSDPIPLTNVFKLSELESLTIIDADRNFDTQNEDVILAGDVSISVEGVTATYTAGGATVTTPGATSGVIGMSHELDFSGDPDSISFAVVEVTGTDPSITLYPVEVSVAGTGTTRDVLLEIPFETASAVTDAPIGTFTLVAVGLHEPSDIDDLTMATSSGDPFIVIALNGTVVGPSNTQSLSIVSSPLAFVNGVDFQETGDNTGVFVPDLMDARIPLTVGSFNNVSPTVISLTPATIGQDPAVVISYADPASDPSGSSTFSVVTRISSDPATLSAPGVVGEFDMFTLTLTDADLDTDSAVINSYTVPIAASETAFLGLAGMPHTMGFFLTEVEGTITEVPGYNVTFIETGPGTGIFGATVDMSIILAGLDIDDGDQVEFTYNDYYANHTTGVSLTISAPPAAIQFERSVYSVDNLATVLVVDSSANTAAVDTVIVNVYSDTDLVGTSVTLTETGPNTGVFEEDISFTTVGVSGGSTVLVSLGDNVTASYGSQSATAIISPAIYLDKTNYATIAESPIVTVADDTANTNPMTAETISISVFSDTAGGPLAVMLTETGPDTDVFVGSFGLKTDTIDPCPTCLLVSDGDTITATYISASGPTPAAPATATFGASSPDDTKIAFTSQRDGNQEVYIMNSDGSNQTRLTNNPAFDTQTSFSPDGKIAFATNRDGNFEIYVMDPDGTNLVNLSNNTGGDTQPRFSADGTKIVFNSNRDGGLGEIYVMNADGTNQINLSQHPANDFTPSFSPDGTKVLFASQRDGNVEIYIMNSDGTNQTNLSNNPASDGFPSFSPDGSKILFVSQRDGNNEIYVMNADGTNPVNLSNNPAVDTQPRWSSDGTRIAFATDRDGNSEIYTMNSDGTGQTNLTNHPAADNSPDWSPSLASTGISVTTDKAIYATGETVMVSGDVGGALFNATDVVDVTSVELQDLLGNPMAFQPGVQSIISLDVVNLETTVQPFAATVQVRKSDGTPELVAWQTGTLPASASTQIGLSWTPEADDDYTIRILIFGDISSLEPLYRGATYDVRNDILTEDNAQSQAVLRVFNPSGIIYRFEQVEVFTDGSFADSFLLAGSLAEAGNYTLIAVYGADSAETTFNLNPITIEVSDTNPPWGVDVAANVTVTGAQAGDYVIVSQGNGMTFTYPAFAGSFDGQLELAVFAYNTTEVGDTFDVSATLYDSSDNPIATSNIVQVTVEKRPATLTLRLPTGVVNGTIFTASGNLADGITGFGLSGRTVTFTTSPGILLGDAVTQGIEVVDPNGIEIVSCPVPQCTHDNPNASVVNLLKLNNGAMFNLPPDVTTMALTLQNMSGTVTVKVTRSDGSFFTATSDPAGINLATFMLSARDAGHQTQFLESVEILSTSTGEQFATSKIELSDADADPTTLILATFDLLPAGSYGTSLTIVPGAYYSSAISPIIPLLSVPVTAQFAGDSLYDPQVASGSFDTVLGFDLSSAGIGGSLAIYANANPSFTVLSCSAADPDSDGDGLCDSWEDPAGGIPYACGNDTCLFTLPITTVPGTGDVQTMSKDRKDIFVEIDAMEGYEPLDAALRRVIEAFAAAPVENPDGTTGITLHVIKDQMNLTLVGREVGSVFNAWVDPVEGGDDGDKTNDYFGIKSVNYGTNDDERSDPALKNARANAIRYSLWVGSIADSTTSGLAEDLGNDMIVSLGSFAMTETEQAATFMHEIGHLLNLKHGGPGEIVTKVEGAQADAATKSSGGLFFYPRETILGGYTVTAMGPGSGTIKLQQAVDFGGSVSGITSLTVSEDSAADLKLGTPTISIDGSSTSTRKVFNIHYPFEVPHAEPIENANYAINFGSPNSNKYLRAADNRVYDVTTQDFWMAGMFKRMGDSGAVEILQSKKSGASATNGYRVIVNSADRLTFDISGGSSGFVTSVTIMSPTIELNNWYAYGVSATRNSLGTVWLYDIANGTLYEATGDISAQNGTLTNGVLYTVARNSNSAVAFFAGQTDNVIPTQIGQTLTREQFLAMAQGDFSNIAIANLYDFNDGASASDVIGNNHLTMNGSPTFSLGTMNVDSSVQEMSLGQLKINFNVSPNVNIIGFGTPAYPSVTAIIPEDNSKNCKPNYQSILSYSRQMDNYLNGPGEHVLDYSRGYYAPLLETNLDEHLGLFSNVILSYPYNVIIYGSPGLSDAEKVQKALTYGPGESVIGIDWNMAVADAVSIDRQANINNLSIDGCNAGGIDEFDTVTFYDYNDWNNINLNWKANALGTFDGITRAANKAATEMTQEIAEQIENQITTIKVDTLTDDQIIYGENIGISGSTSNAPENAKLSIDWGDGTTELFEGVVDPLTGNWPLSGLLSHTYGSNATGERRIIASLMDDAGSVQASSSGTTVLVLKDTTVISLNLTPSALSVAQQFTLTGTLSNLDHPGQGVAGRIITFTSSDPGMIIAPATTDASGNFMQTAIAGSAGTFEITAHFEIPTDTDEDVVVLPSQSTPQTLVVSEFSFSGSLSPIKADGSSVFKQKSTIPIKFQLIDSDGNFITDAVATLRLVKIIDGVGGTEIAPPEDSDGLFKYDAENNQYQYNLKTRLMDAGTWGIRIYLNYGTPEQMLLDSDGDGYTAKITLRP